MRLPSLLLALTLWLTSAAQLTPAGAFASAPSSVIPLLDRNTRLDMIDYFTHSIPTASANRLDGQSIITEMTPTSVTVKLTESSSMQIALLPVKSDTILAVINTVATPGLDSGLSFYTRSWEPLPVVKYFIAPTWSDWVVKGHNINAVTESAPFMLTSYYINPADNILTVTNNLSFFLDKDTYERIAPDLYPTLSYRWDGKKFVKERT
ncbi:MAG: DUF3256 family protein [Duncaniella sp.]|nr:DUF3256 family protein [Duncaniella sp.]